jgi:DNA-binding transcriptional regulator YiaG
MATKQREIERTKARSAIIQRSKKTAPKAVQTTAAAIALVAEIRNSLGLNRKLFARLTGYSERAIAQWESGTKLSGASVQKMTEMRRLQRALTKVMQPDFVSQWLQSPNESFGGLKPLEVVERGEIDRVWQMVFELESGVPG